MMKFTTEIDPMLESNPIAAHLRVGRNLMHLKNFHFVDKSGTTIANIVAQTFENPIWVVIYVLAMIAAAVHVSHGFWSAFQTVGANHLKYMPIIMILSIIFSLIVGLGFGLLPIFVSFTG